MNVQNFIYVTKIILVYGNIGYANATDLSLTYLTFLSSSK